MLTYCTLLGFTSKWSVVVGVAEDIDCLGLFNDECEFNASLIYKTHTQMERVIDFKY